METHTAVFGQVFLVVIEHGQCSARNSTGTFGLDRHSRLRAPHVPAWCLSCERRLRVPANRARLTRAGPFLLPTRSILSRSTPAQLRSPLRRNGGRRCGAPRSRRIGRPDGAGANRCHRIVSRHRARRYKPISDAETTTRARIPWDRLGKRTSRRRRCPPDGTGTSLTHKLRISTVWDSDHSWIVLLPGHCERGGRGGAQRTATPHPAERDMRGGTALNSV